MAIHNYGISSKSRIHHIYIGARFQDEGREWRLSDLFYANDLVLCDEPEEDLRAMVGHFVEVYRRRGLKINADKNKVMVLNREGTGARGSC